MAGLRRSTEGSTEGGSNGRSRASPEHGGGSNGRARAAAGTVGAGRRWSSSRAWIWGRLVNFSASTCLNAALQVFSPGSCLEPRLKGL